MQRPLTPVSRCAMPFGSEADQAVTRTTTMKHSILFGSVAVCLSFGLSAPVHAAEPATTGVVSQSSPSEAVAVGNVAPSAKCLDDLRIFDKQMEKDGYWLGGSGFSY